MTVSSAINPNDCSAIPDNVWIIVPVLLEYCCDSYFVHSLKFQVARGNICRRFATAFRTTRFTGTSLMVSSTNCLLVQVIVYHTLTTGSGRLGSVQVQVGPVKSVRNITSKCRTRMRLCLSESLKALLAIGNLLWPL